MVEAQLIMPIYFGIIKKLWIANGGGEVSRMCVPRLMPSFFATPDSRQYDVDVRGCNWPNKQITFPWFHHSA